MHVRAPILAGKWYPAAADALARAVDGHIAAARAERRAAPGRPVAIVAPHAGYEYSGAVAGHAYATLEPGAYDRVIVLAVSHFASFRGASMLDVDAYATPLGEVPLVSPGERERLRRAAGLVNVGVAHAREHSLEIQLPFLQRALGSRWQLVPLLLRDLDAPALARLGHALRPWFDARTLVVASSDFTHYGGNFEYEPFPPDAQLFEKLATLDEGAVERILARDAAGLLAYQRESGITMCGIKPVACMIHMLPADAVGRALAYDTSGRMTSDRRHSVSYQALCFRQRHEQLGLSAAREVQLLAEARAEVQRAAAGEPSPPLAGEPMPAADVFVTLRRGHGGPLRGCIGSVGSPRPLLEAVRQAARGAALRDPRFAPVRPDEVEGLAIDVSVLTPPQPIQAEDIVLGQHGVSLEQGRHRGVFLPEVAIDAGWGREQLLAELCRKADLPEDAWRSPQTRLTAFETIAFADAAAP